MAAKKPHQSVGDYVTMGLSPVLIIALLVSLVFFLIEVLYGGRQYERRLLWTFFWFIFGIVWVARISMHPAIAERAKLYGIILAVGVWFGVRRFLALDQVTGAAHIAPLTAFDWLIELGLLALVWWSAYRLTWDCTYIDDSVDASGKGVLEAAGLENGGSKIEAGGSKNGEKPSDAPRSSLLAPPSSGLFAWWERYRRHREAQRRRPHTPGVWVVYFSLAALPLFGLGQALIPPEAIERRRYAFWLLGLYVVSGLGLLLTTCYLGLRRYLRQRKLKMPAAMTGMWLTLGGGMIVGMVVLGALLPRPYSEYSLLGRAKGKPRDLAASQHAVLSGDAGQGKGKSGEARSSNDPKAASSPNAKSEQKGGGQGRDKSSGQGEPRDGKGQDQTPGKNNSRDDRTTTEKSNADPKEKSSKDSSGKAKSNEGSSEQSQGSAASPAKEEEGDTSSQDGTSSSSRNFLEPLTSKLDGVARILKWVVFAVLAIVLVILLLRSGLRFLAHFTDWARQLLASWRAWWEKLFGTASAGDGAATAAVEEERGPEFRPFAAYANPFRDGTAERVSPEQVVRHSYAALEAWARERGLGRALEETPLEFAERLGEELPAVEDAARQLAALYALAVYARGSLASACLPRVRVFWQCLESLEREPVGTPG